MFKNEKLVKKGRPVVFKDGKKVDFSSVNDQWIDGDILKEEMKYIAKMTEGLTTGTMSSDKDYIELKNKIVQDMISDKVISLKKRLCQSASKKSNIYDHAQKIQDEALKGVQSYAAQIAKDNTIEIYLDEKSGEYLIKRDINPISARRTNANYHSYRWCTIDAKTLKEEITKRGEGIGESRKNEPDATSERILKEVEEKLNAQKLNKKSSKFVKTVLDAKKKKSFMQSMESEHVSKADMTPIGKKAHLKKIAEIAKKKASKKNETIYDRLELSKYETYELIPAGKKAWISIHARKQGKDPNKVKKQIKTKMLKVAGKGK